MFPYVNILFHHRLSERAQRVASKASEKSLPKAVPAEVKSPVAIPSLNADTVELKSAMMSPSNLDPISPHAYTFREVKLARTSAKCLKSQKL